MRFKLIYNGYLIIEWRDADLREADPGPDFSLGYKIVYGDAKLWDKRFTSVEEAMQYIDGGLNLPAFSPSL